MGDRRVARIRSIVMAAGFACLVPAIALAQGAEGEPAPEGADGEQGEQAPAEAPAVVKDPKVVKTWLKAGDTLMRKGDQLTKQGKEAEAKTSYENAATAYQRAIEASEDGTAIQLQLATALDKAGDAPGAMKALKPAAAQTANADLAKKAQTKLDEVSMKVGVVTLTVVPDHTSVSLGGKPIGEAPLPEPLILLPGTHVVSFAAVGYQPKDVELKIEAGSESERKIELEPVPIVTKPEVSEPEAPVTPEAPARPSLLPIYIGGGATVGLLVIGAVTGIAAVGKQNQYEDSNSPTEREDLRSSGKTLALVTDLCLLGTIGAAAFTTYWYMVKYRPVANALAEREAAGHHKRGTTAKVDVVPWVQPDAGGVLAVGTF